MAGNTHKSDHIIVSAKIRMKHSKHSVSKINYFKLNNGKSQHRDNEIDKGLEQCLELQEYWPYWRN